MTDATAPAELHPEDDRTVALHQHALDLLMEVGYDAMTMDALARRAHVSKATIYRRWPGKASLVVDALQHDTRHSVADEDHGSLREDLLAMVSSMAGDEDRAALLVTAVAHAARRDPELAACVRARLVSPSHAAHEQVLERAIARGELSEAARTQPLLMDVLPSLLIVRLIFGLPIDPDTCVDLVDTVLPLFAPYQED